jgi:hypothetical protein
MGATSGLRRNNFGHWTQNMEDAKQNKTSFLEEKLTNLFSL